MRRASVLSLLLVLISAVAEAQGRGAAKACAPIVPDTARFGEPPVYAACEVTRGARLRSGPGPRAEFPEGVQLLEAEVEFVVDESGAPLPATARLLSATTPAFGVQVLDVLPKWRYRPAERDGVAVRQLVTRKLSVKDSRRPFTVPTTRPTR